MIENHEAMDGIGAGGRNFLMISGLWANCCWAKVLRRRGALRRKKKKKLSSKRTNAPLTCYINLPNAIEAI